MFVDFSIRNIYFNHRYLIKTSLLSMILIYLQQIKQWNKQYKVFKNKNILINKNISNEL